MDRRTDPKRWRRKETHQRVRHADHRHSNYYYHRSHYDPSLVSFRLFIVALAMAATAILDTRLASKSPAAAADAFSTNRIYIPRHSSCSSSSRQRRPTPFQALANTAKRKSMVVCWDSTTTNGNSPGHNRGFLPNDDDDNDEDDDNDDSENEGHIDGYVNGYMANGYTNGHSTTTTNNNNNNNNNQWQRLHVDDLDDDDDDDLDDEKYTVQLGSNDNPNNNGNLLPSNRELYPSKKNGLLVNNINNNNSNNGNNNNGNYIGNYNGGADPTTSASSPSNPVVANGYHPTNGKNGKSSSSSSSSSTSPTASARGMPLTAPEVNRWILSKDMFAQAAQRTNTRNGNAVNGHTIINGNSHQNYNPNNDTSTAATTSTTTTSSHQITTHIYNNRLHLLQHYPELKDLNDYDRHEIDSYWDQLLPMVSYLGTQVVAKIYNALMVAYRAHREQVRKSGEPFIIHPVEVAKLLAGLKMDGDTIMAGLLHDTVEDTDLTFDQIEAMFGRVVRSIVEGETKVSKLPKLAFQDYADEQAENLRQMFVAMTDDYRIIIVKLADRLHNMRTLRHMKPEKQVKISRETLDIFAPLAHRMGIWQFKSELEDTAFMYLYPQEYKRLNKRLRQHQKKFRETLDKSQDILKRTLDRDPTLIEQAAEVRVYGRTKEIYSLWHKMETKGEQNLDHIVDVVALRVILTPKGEVTMKSRNTINGRRQTLDTATTMTSSIASSTSVPSLPPHPEPGQHDRGVWLCYHVLGLVQHLPGFQPVPTRVKDYISFPKPNGYQSLHTALMLNGQTIEVQIRTNLMHQVAEYGMASHWAYTDGKRQQQQLQSSGTSSSYDDNDSDDCSQMEEELYNTPWLSSIKEWQDDIISSRDFVDSVRRELLGKRVFVFLRNGKILNLARGATAIDAAFAIHTEVGLAMHAVEINGKPVSFSYELRNGDVVSVMTGEGKPAVDWMRFAKSRSTRSKLRSYFRKKQKESLREAGRILLTDYLWMHGPLIEKASFLKGDWEIPTTVEELAAFSKGRIHYEDIDDLLIDIGKRHDRMFLHGVVSKLFQVPERALVEAEKNKRALVPTSVVVAVHESRQQAKDAAAAATADSESEINVDLPPASTSNFPKIRNATTHLEKLLHGLEGGTIEFADHEQMCQDCLPVLGDEILGTRPAHSSDAATTVHRLGCPHAQRAINQIYALKGIPTDLKGRVNSVTLRSNKANRYYGKRSLLMSSSPCDDVPVRLRWSDMPDEEQISFMTEIKIVAEDRKLLLADCSGVVSQMSEIVKTGSATTHEHAVLVFLVRVGGLEDLQQLMDSLRQIRSVMSVERAFGSELL